jgi:hypothetical protein
MSTETSSSTYILIPEGCQFVFPEATDDDSSIDFDQAPKCMRFVFQGRALAQFMLAGIQLLRKQVEQAEKNKPEHRVRLQPARIDALYK